MALLPTHRTTLLVGLLLVASTLTADMDPAFVLTLSADESLTGTVLMLAGIADSRGNHDSTACLGQRHPVSVVKDQPTNGVTETMPSIFAVLPTVAPQTVQTSSQPLRGINQAPSRHRNPA